jgi:hypothetical protein
MSRLHGRVAIGGDHICIARSSFRTSSLIRRNWCCSVSGNETGYEKQKETRQKTKESNMLRKLLGVAAMAASTYAFVPAHAAQIGFGCSGEDQARVEGTVETMADGPGKFTAQREVAQAQDAMLNGNMRGCAMHLGRAMNAGSATQAPYANTLAQAPAETTPETTQQAPSQSQWGWKPMKGAY